MYAFDIVIISIVGFFLIRGIFRGSIKECFSIIGVIVGFLAALTFYSATAQLFAGWVTNQGYLNLLNFMAIFLIVYVIISVSGVIIKYLLKISILGWVDHIFGAIFGALKGGLIAGVLLLALISFLPAGAPIIRDSNLSPYVFMATEKMALILPKEMKTQFTGKVNDLKKAWGIQR